MRLYNAMATGQLHEGENVLIQVVPPAGGRRLKVIGWNVSFNNLIAGNSISVELTQDDTDGSARQSGVPAVLDGSYFGGVGSTEPSTRWDFTSEPTANATICGPHQVSDPSFLLRQYASGKELVISADERISVRCTPSGMTAATGYKVNLTFHA